MINSLFSCFFSMLMTSILKKLILLFNILNFYFSIAKGVVVNDGDIDYLISIRMQSKSIFYL
ncbi:MAG: hypothetical protein RLZZ175_3304 [Bacteroidota bacterium]|jgi:hypothetical protein